MTELSLRKEWKFLIALALLALLIRGWMLAQVRVIGPDEAYYVRVGQYLAGGKPFSDFQDFKSSFPSSSHLGQPLLPYLYSLFFRFHAADNPLVLCQILSILFSVSTLIFFHWGARSILTPGAALWADLIYVIDSGSIRYSLLAMPHALFNLLYIALFWMMTRFLKDRKRGWIFLAGLTGWALYMTRVEGICFVFFLGALGLILRMKKEAALFFLTFVCFLIPILFVIRASTGLWSLTWTDPCGMLGIALKHWAGNGWPGFPVFYLKGLLKIYGSWMPQSLPLFIWMLTGVGFLRCVSLPNHSRLFMAISFLAFPFLFYPCFLLEARYLFPGILFFIMFAGAGAQELIRVFSSAGFFGRFLRLSMGSLIFAHLLIGAAYLLYDLKSEPMEYKRAGEWMKEHYHEAKVILGTDTRICFYAGNSCKEMVVVPHESSGDKAINETNIASVLQNMKVDLVAADTRYIRKYFPSLRFLIENPPPDILKPLVELKEDNEKITVYEARNHSAAL